MEEAAPGSESATAHGLLSPEELEEFLDNQPDDAENEEFSVAPAENEHTADTMPTVSDGLNEPVEAKPDVPVASAPGNANEAADRAAEHPGNANEAADRAAEYPGNAIKTEDGPEEEHLPTRQELVQKHNAQIRRENNRRYAQEHASRATRRWQEESEQEPFAIVRGTCYYSALESENTVRGNFSKSDTKMIFCRKQSLYPMKTVNGIRALRMLMILGAITSNREKKKRAFPIRPGL